MMDKNYLKKLPNIKASINDDDDEYDDEYNYLRIQEVDKWFVEQDVTLATDEQEGEEVIVLLWW